MMKCIEKFLHNHRLRMSFVYILVVVLKTVPTNLSFPAVQLQGNKKIVIILNTMLFADVQVQHFPRIYDRLVFPRIRKISGNRCLSGLITFVCRY